MSLSINNTKKEAAKTHSQVVIKGQSFDFSSKSFWKQVEKVEKEIKKMMDNSIVDPQKLSNNFTV